MALWVTTSRISLVTPLHVSMTSTFSPPFASIASDVITVTVESHRVDNSTLASTSGSLGGGGGGLGGGGGGGVGDGPGF